MESEYSKERTIVAKNNTGFPEASTKHSLVTSELIGDENPMESINAWRNYQYLLEIACGFQAVVKVNYCTFYFLMN